MIRKPFRLAAAAVSALAITGVCSAPMAFADVNDPTKVAGVSQEAANPSLVNPSATVQLTIEKHLGATTGQVNDGTAQSVTTPKLQGVNFDIYEVVGVDLTTNEGWTAAAAAKDAQPNAALTSVEIGGVTHSLVKVATVTTGEDGVASFTRDNGVGLYFVKENLSTSGTITDLSSGASVDATTITPSSPFFVTLPMTHPTNLNSWMYDVRVYPKNQVDSIEKTVEDKATIKVGDELSYTLTSTISSVEKLGYYYIGDNNQYVDVKAVSLTIAGTSTNVQLTGCDATNLGAGPCDYYFWLDSDEGQAGSQLKIVFSEGGLTKLQDAKKADSTAKVVTTIDGKVLSVPESGELPNTGSFIPNSDWYFNNGGDPENPPVVPPTDPDPENPPVPPTDPPEIPSNEVKSYFGNITVDKRLTGGASTDTAVGATFAVYVDPTPTTECTADDVKGDPVLSQSITAGNTVTFAPLRASNWANNKALANSSVDGWIQYCVVETKAPDGYNLNAQPFAATIDWKTGSTTLTRTADVVIHNEKSNLDNELPLTGGEGVAALSLGGLVLIGGGAAYYVAASRKRRDV